MKKHIDYLVKWLRKKVKESNTNGLIVGLSGGIDSSVCAALIKKAFPNDSLGVILPCSSNSIDKKYAIKLAENIDIEYKEINISNEHQMLYSKIENVSDIELDDNNLVKANLKARLRMSTIYGLANAYNYLVIGTDNAAELLTGYFTKYGDGGVDIMPIANLTKGEVYDMAKELNVTKEIIERPPTAGLWEGQTDENEMGTTYKKIDKYIKGKEIPLEDKKIIEKMNKVSEHKRNLPPSPKRFIKE